jgi:solute carrier family 25 phosphate transporter 23/24/25/41
MEKDDHSFKEEDSMMSSLEELHEDDLSHLQHEDLSQTDYQTLEDLFHKYARQRNATQELLLTRRQLRRILRALGNKLTRNEVDQVLALSGVRKEDKYVDLKTFRSMFDVSRLRQVFGVIDSDKSGQIGPDELKVLMDSLGIKASYEDAKDMLVEIDKNKDGRIDFGEFYERFKFVPLANLTRVGRTWSSIGGLDWGLDNAAFILPDVDRFVDPKSQEFLKFFISGGIAQVVSRTVTAPLERLKLQAQTEGLASSMISELKTIVKTEGFRGLFAGNVANCLRVFPTTAIGCFTYVQILSLLHMDNDIDPRHRVRDLSTRIAAGAFGGMVATLSTYPLDLIRTRMTLSTTESVTNTSPVPVVSNAVQETTAQGRSKIMNIGRDILRQEGVRGLYRGSGPAIMSIGPFIFIQNGTFTALKTLSQEELGLNLTPNVLLACGATSGFMAQLAVYPLEVVRRRMQVSMVETGQSSWQILKEIHSTEGFRGLYQGILPTALKVAPAVAISLYVRDLIRPYFTS